MSEFSYAFEALNSGELQLHVPHVNDGVNVGCTHSISPDTGRRLLRELQVILGLKDHITITREEHTALNRVCEAWEEHAYVFFRVSKILEDHQQLQILQQFDDACDAVGECVAKTAKWTKGAKK